MGKFLLGKHSRENLIGVHPDLVLVVGRAIQITPGDFTVLEGVRTIKRQRKLVASGASKTMKSKHLTGDAVDLGAWDSEESRVAWDWPLYSSIAKAMKQAAADLRIPIEWGGDWKSFKDGPHFQRKI